MTGELLFRLPAFLLAVFLAALAASSAANAEDAYEVVGAMEAEFLERAKHA